ncbi:MAG: nucleotidyltransferase family protein [Sphingomonadales bacterium]|nr:nucleotidyltransferase family protein [Sphingomonadales bacterium]
MSGLHAMLMTAGLGTRMRPLTNDKPKPLVFVGGKPLLAYTLDKLREAGISDCVANVHYLPEQIEAYMASDARDLNVTISDERALLLETGGGLVKAQKHLKSDPFYCINSDSIWTDGAVDALTRLAKAWNADTMDCLMLVVPRERAHQHPGKGDFFLDDAMLPVRRGSADHAPYVYIGIQLLSHAFLDNPPKGAFSTNILWDRALAEGRMFALIHDGDWYDIGSPQAIAPTEEALLVRG